MARKRTTRLGVERLEERRLLADLRLTNVLIIEPDQPGTSITPVIGERICVRASYTASNMPASPSYRLEYVVDGVALSQAMEAGTAFAAGGLPRPAHIRCRR
jgi:hypothetical protein